MSSYAISERVNAQVVLWAIGGAVCRAGFAVGNAYRAMRSILPTLLFALAIVAKALGLVAIVAGTVAIVACIPVTFWAAC